MMDLDIDYQNLVPTATVYGSKAVMLDPANQDQALLGSLNAMCIGVTPQDSEFAPGITGNTAPPFILAQPGDGSYFSAYGQGRRCLWDVDDTWVGQTRPNDLLICGNAGGCRRASPFGPWNQWILAICLTFTNPGFSANVRIIGPWAWNPTGS